MPQKKTNITLVGPVYPYRGGIAQYNTQLHRELSEQGSSRTISFKRQYPKWLYPGKSDVEIGASDNKEPGSEYIIDVYSPISLFRAVDKIMEQKPDLVVLTWWTLFWQPSFALISFLLRRKGIRTAYICHNVFDHDAGNLKKRISKKFLGQVDAYLVHSTEEERQLTQLFKRPLLILNSLHPIYEQYPKPSKSLSKRGRIELLFFGFIRPYKGLETLVNALAMLDDRDIHLTVVGEPWMDAEKLSVQLQNIGAPNIELKLEYVNEHQLANYFGRADVVVLPYKSATGSGVASIAYHYRKPILGTRVGGLKDVIIEGKTGWLVEPESAKALALKISELSREEAANKAPFIGSFCKEHSWAKLAEQLRELSAEINMKR